ncbi:30S ribosomal protein S1 [Alphaproteobacteria bacterium]|nr:30S ribosomal protein S1 [Alphaproteobacteria bacterium]
MATETAASGDTTTMSDENFVAMLEETFGEGNLSEGSVVKGTVIAIEGDSVLIDVGLKSEGRVGVREFTNPSGDVEISSGDIIDVYLERMEDRNGEAVLSREKARREEAWTMLEKAFNDTERVTGSIFGRVKGGFTVDLSGAIAFLPGSQVDVRPVRDISPLMGTPQPFQILKMDRRRGNIVVSRRAVLEESRAEQRAELLAGLTEGQVVDGIVKNLTDYGAFVDLGGVDGLLHVTDIAWRRINHPSKILSVGQTLKVQIIRFNSDTQRISLGMKQLEADPWDGVESKYPVGAKYTGRVSNITDYGAFVELEPGVEGLVHVSEMSWTKKNVHPGKIISTSQEVDVMVLDVDPQKRRISLGIKQTEENPWTDFATNNPVGTELEGEVKNVTEFGLFVGLIGEIDGMVHLSDLSWDKSGEDAIKEYNKGDIVKAKVMDIDIEKERISLGIKQLTDDPFKSASEGLKKGDTVTCTVAKVLETGIEVTVAGSVAGFIRRNDLSRERSEQRPDRFAEGDRLDAVITNIDRRDHKLTLSIKTHEFKEEKQAMAEYGSSDSGASLGDILGAAMRKAEGDTAGSLDVRSLADKKQETPKAEDTVDEETPVDGEAEDVEDTTDK